MISINKKDKVRLVSGSLALVLDVIVEGSLFSVFVDSTRETLEVGIDEIKSIIRYKDIPLTD